MTGGGFQGWTFFRKLIQGTFSYSPSCSEVVCFPLSCSVQQLSLRGCSSDHGIWKRDCGIDQSLCCLLPSFWFHHPLSCAMPFSPFSGSDSPFQATFPHMDFLLNPSWAPTLYARPLSAWMPFLSHLVSDTLYWTIPLFWHLSHPTWTLTMHSLIKWTSSSPFF